MISRINSINAFGPFFEYEWPDDLAEFQKRNVLFGWNASGKTSLCRLLASCENQKLPSGDSFKGAMFSISFLSDDRVPLDVTHQTLEASPVIKVYNSDYVDSMFDFKEGEKLDPINIIIGDRTKKEIPLFEDLKTRKVPESKNALAVAKEKAVDAKNNVNKHIDRTARSVRDALGIVGNKFNVTKVKQYFDAFEKNADAHLSDEDQRMCRIEQNIEGKNVIENQFAMPWEADGIFDKFILDVGEVFERKVVREILEDKQTTPEMNKWIQDGLPLHKDKKVCAFCDGKLTDERVSELNNRFSGEYRRLQNDVDGLLKELELNGSGSSTQLHDIHLLDDTLTERYEKGSRIYLAAIGDFNNELSAVRRSLVEKKNSPFSDVVFSKEAFVLSYKNLAESTRVLNGVVEEHNRLQNSIIQRRNSAFDKITRHEAIKYFDDYQQKIRDLVAAQQIQLKCQEDLDELQAKLAQIRASVVRPAKGANHANKYLKTLLCSDSILLSHKDGEIGYQLLREGRPAEHLSEGEKTAITFVYFVASLEDESIVLKDTILVIDDPVSSLDSNKVYATYGIIKEMLWSECRQIFILTHHFQFLKLFPPPRQDKIEWYVVEKEPASSPVLKKCPSLITEFQSEYYYLFYKLHSLVLDEKNFYISRNILRRFLENFIQFKLGHGDLESKASSWIEDKALSTELIKFLHAGSHLNGSDDFVDLRKFPSLFYRTCRLIKEKDPDHHNALIGYVNKNRQLCRPSASDECTECPLVRGVRESGKEKGLAP
jgi:wobble nucleotide-excising tRNase